jgi:hypothetical protein
LSLLPTTREFLALVERETGYPVKLLEDPNLPTLAAIRIARGATPAHFLTYKPTRDDSLDYSICYQCGFVLRLFETPPEQRFDFACTARGRDEVSKEMVGPGGTLAGRGLSPADAEQVAGMVFDGLMTHLRSIPVGLRIADWIHANYPALRASQHTTAWWSGPIHATTKRTAACSSARITSRRANKANTLRACRRRSGTSRWAATSRAVSG